MFATDMHTVPMMVNLKMSETTCQCYSYVIINKILTFMCKI